MKCDHRSDDGFCKLQRGYCTGFLDWLLCVHEDRELLIITIILVFLCLSIIGILEMAGKGWLEFLKEGQ